jgi:hypothetical protein
VLPFSRRRVCQASTAAPSGALELCRLLDRDAQTDPAAGIDRDSLELSGEQIRLSGLGAPEGRQLCQRGVCGFCSQVIVIVVEAGLDASAAKLDLSIVRRVLSILWFTVPHHRRLPPGPSAAPGNVAAAVDRESSARGVANQGRQRGSGAVAIPHHRRGYAEDIIT